MLAPRLHSGIQEKAKNGVDVKVVANQQDNHSYRGTHQSTLTHPVYASEPDDGWVHPADVCNVT